MKRSRNDKELFFRVQQEITSDLRLYALENDDFNILNIEKVIYLRLRPHYSHSTIAEIMSVSTRTVRNKLKKYKNESITNKGYILQ